jgi:hypothetical protein
MPDAQTMGRAIKAWSKSRAGQLPNSNPQTAGFDLLVGGPLAWLSMERGPPEGHVAPQGIPCAVTDILRHGAHFSAECFDGTFHLEKTSIFLLTVTA